MPRPQTNGEEPRNGLFALRVIRNAEQIEVNFLQNGDETLLFAANPAATCISTQVKFVGAKSFRPAWGAGEAAVEGETLAVTLEPYSIQIWEVARD